jgi:hypothetical protein
MTDCDDDRVDRVMPDLGGGDQDQTPDPGDSILVTDPQATYATTARQESDVHTAVVRGLAGYLAGLTYAVNGRVIALTHITTDWADHDVRSYQPPTACVHSEEEGGYSDDVGMTIGEPEVVGDRDAQRVLAIHVTSWYELSNLAVDVWCSDKIQRSGVRRMLEDAFSPVTWMAGFRLVLPRYHSAQATYYCDKGKMGDSAESAASGLWPLSMVLSVTAPVCRLFEYPRARPIVRGKSRLRGTV